jgi:hypothetical protein
VPVKVKQINEYLFSNTLPQVKNKQKRAVNDVKGNVQEMTDMNLFCNCN